MSDNSHRNRLISIYPLIPTLLTPYVTIFPVIHPLFAHARQWITWTCPGCGNLNKTHMTPAQDRLACTTCEKPFVVGLVFRPIAPGPAGKGRARDQVIPHATMRQHVYNPVPWTKGSMSHMLLDEDDSNTDELDV